MSRKFNVPKKYTHFAIIKSNSKVLTGWDYKKVEAEDIKYYSKMDIEDLEFNPKDVKVYSVKQLAKLGINPYDWSNWNSFIAPEQPAEKTLQELQKEIRTANTKSYLNNRRN